MNEFGRTVVSRGVVGKPERAPAPDGLSPLLYLQRTAGNRAVAGLIARGVVQRHPGPTANAEVEEAPATEAPATEAPATEAPATEAPATETAAPAGAESATQPGTGTTGTTGSGITGAARTKAINDALGASATGMWALAIISKWKIPIDYEYGGTGSFHQGGKIYLNKTLGVGGAALVLMHEAQHANTYKSGNQADPTKMGREEYIKKSIADEAEAVVRQIEGLAVTKGLGVDMAGAGVTDELKNRYLVAFNAKRDELRKANPTMSTAEINAICRTFARDGEVTKMFHDGTFITSTDKNSYAVFYGVQWDKLTKPPSK